MSLIAIKQHYRVISEHRRIPFKSHNVSCLHQFVPDQASKMTLLNSVLCLALLCGLCVGIPSPVPGAPRTITSEAELTELRHNVTTQLEKLNAENGTQFELVQIYRATRQVVAGVLYKIFAEIKENNTHIVNCTMSLLENTDDSITFRIDCGLKSDQAETITKPNCGCGGLFPLTNETLHILQPKVTEAFRQLREKYKDFDLYLKSIPFGMGHIVSGMRYLLIIEATRQMHYVEPCQADIWEKSWENFFEVKLTCSRKFYEIVLAVNPIVPSPLIPSSPVAPQ